MGKRGPGAARLKLAAARAPQRAAGDAGPLFDGWAPLPAATAAHPWEKEGMPPEEQVLAFLRTLPVVSGLRAGETLELLEFQETFVRSVYGSVNGAGHRRVRLAAVSFRVVVRVQMAVDATRLLWIASKPRSSTACAGPTSKQRPGWRRG